ncbi:iron complex outermembrane receptor protein [Rhodothalassium salexigens DSM 2132]|uniref:Iron complex outermembrane receptor protein n=1 Tax=Rhodothalassium salexigens DSM 2132 TaxID=1188247 RepID=A0A4R2PQA2_RHOSA|nr:TonB-dependent receptor [Rhodothalassium salexigens]MBB4210493.1 iron complex outermembrane receptor protein [Rhodothalassium salexigens DSM 2132]MBK1639439.1 hypothetical protein [Rhodothalassium salexigens DSM 2132]TCP37950.1 iron complex outermembrane receptor protein [Rhodothalassium salexigens DSM 2132]
MVYMLRVFVVVLGGGACVTAAAWGQSGSAGEDRAPPATVADNGMTVEELVITGSASQPRSVLESPVPIDVFSAQDIQDISFADTTNILQTLVPSFNVDRAPISDGATFVRQATLRGLPSDKTLVLINSKRRHRAALVTIGGSGTQGPDIATIPAIALKNVEVLRDGASAQYGSDAIAGVLNFILRDNAEGGMVTAQAGQFYAGDGGQLRGAANLGLPLGDRGFVNVSVEAVTSEATSRSQQYVSGSFSVADFLAEAGPDSAFAINLREVHAFDDKDVVQPWGQPGAEALRSFVNAGFTVSDALELYLFGNYSKSKSAGAFFYRFPGNPVLGPEVRLEDGEPYSFIQRFPAGFTPTFMGRVQDFSVTGGVRGTLTDWLSYDITGRHGENRIAYQINNTVNPSLGPASPTEFSPGNLVSAESGVNGAFTGEFDIGLAGPLFVNVGGNYRLESYEIQPGSVSSFEAGPFSQPDPFNFCNADGTPSSAGLGIDGLDCADPSDPVYSVLPVGANGFPGYSPEFSSDNDRDSYGFFIEGEVNPLARWLVGAAFRWEDFSDFGSEAVYKITSRFEVTDGIALRGSVGTGFRAPTPGQLFTTNVSTRVGPTGEPIASGLFPATNPVSQFLGAEPLDPEKSFQISAGFTARLFRSLDLSVDYYRIAIDDQFFAASPITITDEIRAELVANNVPGALTIGQVQFFTNAFDSITQGVDVVLTYDQSWGAYGDTQVTASFNYNDFQIDRLLQPDLFDAEGRFDFENGLPDWRSVINVTHTLGDWRFLARASLFSGYEQSQVGDTPDTLAAVQKFGAEVLFDFEASYAVTERLRLAAGARNLFDTYPDPGSDAVGETCCGRIYRSDSIVDWQGGFYYFRMEYMF